MSNIIDKAREVFDIEIEGLAKVKEQLNSDFEKLVEKCVEVLNHGGKLVLCGVGKSGHIGKKLAATLASTGTPAVFMHPVEAMHGDLGILESKDVLLALSYSGETDELLSIFPAAKMLGVTTVAITGGKQSRLASVCDILIEMEIHKEACPFNLVPTTSTTALLALGDALAVVLLNVRGFTLENFGRLHPAGAIGRSVTMRVKDLMRKGEKLALVHTDSSVKETLISMTKVRCGAAVVVDDEGLLLGVFTDGDFRRHVEDDLSILDKPIVDVMTPSPLWINENKLAVEVLKLVEKKSINDVVVLDNDGKVVGLVDIQDLPGMKLL
jgi:arabinose-5-phosphate isomerase